jgi:pimeloyl-ACP methyl ester carboxylesterase
LRAFFLARQGCVVDARRFLPPAWAAAWGLCLILLALAVSIPEPRHDLRYIRIENQRRIPLWIVLYFPDPPPSSPAPATIICQPFTCAPEYSRLLALALLRDGFVVATFDWRGRAPGENRQMMAEGAREVLRADVAAAVAYLRTLREVDPERITLAGHSVGGSLAMEAGADDPRIAAVASIGMEADVALDRPRNLLWAVGLYDEFRVLNRMRDVFQASATTSALEGTTVGDFARGTARRLGVSPTADHFTELQDPGIHREVRDWFRQAVGLPPSTQSLWRMEVRQLLLLLAGVAGMAAALSGLRRIASGRPWVVRMANGGALLSAVILTHWGAAYFLYATSMILWLVVFTLLSGFVVACGDNALQRGWRFALRLGIVVWVSLLATMIVNNLAYYIHDPVYLLWLPEFAARHVLDLLYAYLLVGSRPFLFSSYHPETLTPQIWIYALPAVETLRPGLLFSLAARLARQRKRLAATPRTTSPASKVLLVLLLGFLVAVAWLRIRQGFLTAESAWAALRFLTRFSILPIFLFAFVWRRTRRRVSPPTETQLT